MAKPFSIGLVIVLSRMAITQTPVAAHSGSGPTMAFSSNEEAIPHKRVSLELVCRSPMML